MSGPYGPGMGAGIEHWISRHLGDHEVRHRREWHTRHALEVRAADGSRWFAKQAGTDGEWASERLAYRWTRHLGDRTPQLLGAHRGRRLFLVSALPGQEPAPDDPAAAREAGVVLAAFHASRPARPPTSARTWASRRVDRVIARAPGVLTRHEEQFARQQARELEALPPRPRVPCHGDYVSRNWLVDDAGTLRTFDFGLARWQVPAFDLGKLYAGPWWRRPDLGEAFLEGYGRNLEPDEVAYVECQLTVVTVGRLCKSYRAGSPEKARRGRARLRRLMADDTPFTRAARPQRRAS
jgi:Ser/Thr protein kinase RdoA (MazF antagonist)